MQLLLLQSVGVDVGAYPCMKSTRSGHNAASSTPFSDEQWTPNMEPNMSMSMNMNGNDSDWRPGCLFHPRCWAQNRPLIKDFAMQAFES